MSPEALENFSQFYTKVTGKPFDQTKIARVIRPLTTQQQKTNDLLNMLAQGGFDIQETVADNSTKRVNGIDAYLYGFDQDIVEIFPLWNKKNPTISFLYHSDLHIDRSISIESIHSWSLARADVELTKDNQKYSFRLYRSREEMKNKTLSNYRIEPRRFKLNFNKRSYIPLKQYE